MNDDSEEVMYVRKHRKIMTTNMIIELYFLRHDGASIKGTARKLGIPATSVLNCEKYIKKHWTMPASHATGLGIRYHKAVTAIQERLAAEDRQPVLPLAVPALDRFDVLKTSYGRFEEALRSFIAAEVETQVQAKEQEAVPLKEYVQALTKQNRELKAENERLSETLENLKNANWVDTLRMKRQLKV
jgi:hypothetical protein